MIKTGQDVKEDFFALLKGSKPAKSVTGVVCYDGDRPKGNREDIVIIFTTGIPGQIQEGVVTINVFANGRDTLGDGIKRMDGARCAVLERLLQEWIDGLTAAGTCYLIEQAGTVSSFFDPDSEQSITSVKLFYKYYD